MIDVLYCYLMWLLVVHPSLRGVAFDWDTFFCLTIVWVLCGACQRSRGPPSKAGV
jgi:hypothetical protein